MDHLRRTRERGSSGSRPRGRVRRLRACKRCHTRRIKCDASVIGLPCSNCRQMRCDDCDFIESKRIRGPTGRFVTTIQGNSESLTSSALAPSTSSPSSASSRSAEQVPSRDKTAQAVDYALDLSKICFAEKHPGPVIIRPISDNLEQPDELLNLRNKRAEPRTRDQYTPLYKKHEGFIGESWFASYLLRASNHENDMLREHIAYACHSRRAAHDQCHTQCPGGADGESWQKVTREQLPNDLPPSKLVHGLLEAYFTRFHVLYPILNKSEFMEAFREGSLPIALLRCVLFIASIHCDTKIIHRMGYDRRSDAQDDLFNRARQCLDESAYQTRCIQMTCSFLLHYWCGQPSGARDPMWWLAAAVRLAQSIGLHRSIGKSRMAPGTKAHCKRIWWCLYIRDRQASLCAGLPLMINDIECDIEDLTPDDFPDESEATAQFVIAQAGLCRIASNIYFYHLSPPRISLTEYEEHYQTAEREILASLDSWYQSLPTLLRDERQGAHLAVILRIVHSFWKIELLQRLLRKGMDSRTGTKDLTNLIMYASDITWDVEDALLHYESQCFPMIIVSATFAAMTVQYACSRTSGTIGKEHLIQKLRSNLMSLRQFEHCYVSARWIRNIFEKGMEKSGKSGQSTSTSSAETQHVDLAITSEIAAKEVVEDVVEDESVASADYVWDFFSMLTSDEQFLFDT